MTPADEEVFTTWTKDINGDPVSIVYLCGELDASGVPAFLTQTHDVVSSGKNVVMDTHLLDYIDSTGVGAIMNIQKALNSRGLGMSIVGAHGLLSKILEITRLNSELRCYETLEEAISRINDRK